jgi:hypothetical protein
MDIKRSMEIFALSLRICVSMLVKRYGMPKYSHEEMLNHVIYQKQQNSMKLDFLGSCFTEASSSSALVHIVSIL